MMIYHPFMVMNGGWFIVAIPTLYLTLPILMAKAKTEELEMALKLFGLWSFQPVNFSATEGSTKLRC